MRSIFGRCIAIAMMAAIAVAWQSPPVQAAHNDDLTETREAAEKAEAAAADAETAADLAEDEAKDAEKAAEDAEEAAEDAMTANAIVKADAESTLLQKKQADDARVAAEKAARAARAASGSEDDDPNTTEADDASVSADDDAWGRARLSKMHSGKEDGTELGSDDAALDIVPDVDGTSSAWAYARYARGLAVTAETDDAEPDSVEHVMAETAASNAAMRRDSAEEAEEDIMDDDGDGHLATTEEELEKAIAGAKTATMIAAAIAEAAAVAAEKEQADNPSQSNELDAALARQAADDAAAAAADYGTVTGPTPPVVDDDDTDMADDDTGDVDDDDTGEEAMDMGMQVAPNGVGDLLLFAYWTTQMGRDTLLAITNTSNTDRTVHIRMREGMASGDIGDFTICMSGGDVWTAAITSDGDGKSRLLIGNPASGASCGGGTLSGDELPLGAHTFGYLEAYTIDAMYGGADSLAGVATIVSPSEGFASSYNATALVGFDAIDDAAATVNAGGEGTMDMMGTSNNIQMALAREGGVDKEALIGRWTASTEIIESLTQIVLTFPGGGQPGADPITAHVWNEEEDYNTSPRTLTLGREVNVCTFWNATFTGEHVKLECNLVEPGLLIAFEGGWFRFFNNRVGGELDSVSYPPVTRFSAIGLQFSYFRGSNGDFDQSYPIQWMAYSGAGAMNAMGNSAPWYYPMDDDLMMINPGDNMAGSVEMMMEMDDMDTDM